MLNLFKKKEEPKKFEGPNQLTKILNFMAYVPLALLLGAILSSVLSSQQPEPLQEIQELREATAKKMNIFHQVGTRNGQGLYDFLLSQGYDIDIEKDGSNTLIVGFSPQRAFLMVVINSNNVIEEVGLTFDYKRFRKKDLFNYSGKGVYFDDGDFYGYRVNWGDGTSAENYIDRDDRSHTIVTYIN